MFCLNIVINITIINTNIIEALNTETHEKYKLMGEGGG